MLVKQVWVLGPLRREWLGEEGEGEASACRESALTPVARAERAMAWPLALSGNFEQALRKGVL